MNQLLFETEKTQRKNKLGEDVYQAIYFGFTYHYKRTNKDGSKYWFCRHSFCTATLNTLGNRVQKVSNQEYNDQSPCVVGEMMKDIVENDHLHDSNKSEAQREVERCVENMRLRAETENISAGEIYRYILILKNFFLAIIASC